MLRAMLDAFLNLFKSPHTVAYPYKEDLPLPKDYRGLIVYDVEHCTFCDQCEKVCPPKAIVFSQDIDGTKYYRYNPWLCIYCGECVRACPKPDEALWQSDEKPQSALKSDDVNDGWFVWQAEAKAGREAYAAARKAKKAAEAAAKKTVQE